MLAASALVAGCGYSIETGPEPNMTAALQIRQTFDAGAGKSPKAAAASSSESEMKRLDAEARWLGQEVGSLRDLDVVGNDMVRPEAETHPDEPGLSALADVFLRQAGERREQLRKLLAGARVQAFLIDFARFVETRGWLVPEDFGQTGRVAAPVIEFAGHALNKRWKKTLTASP